MKRNKLIVAALVLLCLLAVVTGALRLCRYYLPQKGATSALYERYSNNPCIRATELHNFRVNDTLAVDALLLEATSDSAFYALLRDFGASEELIELYKSDKEQFVGESRHSGMAFTIDINNPKQRMPYNEPDSRVVIGSLAKRSLCVFMTDDARFKEKIFYNELDKTIFHEQNS